MSLETIIFFNLGIYLIGCLGLLSLNNTVFIDNSSFLSVFINVLGIIFSLTLQLNAIENWQTSYKWIEIGSTSINYSVLVNNQTTFMHLLVQVVAVFVQLFSVKYMKNDPGINRFFAFINLFIFAILGLIVSGNLLQLYIFWELVGFCSFLLIGFWYQKKSANDASLKAFLVNRIGDAFFLIGIFLVFNIYGSLDFTVLKNNISQGPILGLAFLNETNLKTTAVLFIFVGVIAKSAQFPLQIWLPDAMEGPTPASALIHAATMVVVGVFLLARLSYIITADAGLFIAFIGAFTSVIAGFSAIFQYDIKKVLAYSTISQIGLMVAGMGIGAVGASLFHLTTHAFFKAGLFLCAGVVINHFRHEQDMRKMGNITRSLPITYYVYLICGAAIIGLPFTSGYLSKEALLTSAISFGYNPENINFRIAIPILLGFSSFFTTIYIVRQAVMVFFERQESPVENIIDGTKKTFTGAFKSFQNILTADDDEEPSGENIFIKFFQNLGFFEVALISLAISSTFILFSATPFEFDKVWFIKNLGTPLVHYFWLPWAVGGVTLLGILISYNMALDELHMFYFKTISKGFKRRIFRIGYHHFYINKFIVGTFSRLFLGKSITPIDADSNNENVVNYKYKNGLTYFIANVENDFLNKIIENITSGFLKIAQACKFVETNYIDIAVKNITLGIKNLGNVIRKIQGGQIQFYLISMMVLILIIILIKLFIN
jgi:NADH-quinone oxidoreductase subunit L